MRDSFVFYRSFYEAMHDLSDEDKGKCFETLANYAINGVEPDDMEPVVRLFFVMAKPQIDKNNQRFENGKNGGRPNNQTETKQKPKNNQTETKLEPNVNVNVNVLKEKDTLKSIQKEKTQNFKKPTVEEIDTYCRESKHYVDVGRFYDFYESKGWKVGKSPMKDWRAAVRNWARSETPAPASYENIASEPTPEQIAEADLMRRRVELTEQLQRQRIEAKYGRIE